MTRVTDPKPHSLSHPILALRHYISVLFSQKKELFHIPPDGLLMRTSLSILALLEGNK